MLKGVSYQGTLIRNRLQDALAILKNKGSELIKSKHKIKNDLSILQRMQEELIEKEKMAALGSLVAGVAHEVNTPVGVAITSVSYCKAEIQKLKKLHKTDKLSEQELEMFLNAADESTQIIQNSLLQAARLIQSFKQISVDQNFDDMRTINIHQYIKDIITTFTNQFKKTGIRIMIDCPNDLVINTYPGSLSQIFNNLLLNVLKHAFDAGQTGNIIIKINLEDNKLLHIVFTDDGKGMDDKMQKQAFEPFVTTDRNMGGSGLGLNIVYNLVVQRFGGNIGLNSLKNNGCQFFITFPVDVSST
ncbi:MAG: HAMP domain-containing histidine kinase [Gammaproteobacteria bacterium]|nr:HAMP domain-containing histidine kinase [Gammaproteobacteria bacterium]